MHWEKELRRLWMLAYCLFWFEVKPLDTTYAPIPYGTMERHRARRTLSSGWRWFVQCNLQSIVTAQLNKLIVCVWRNKVKCVHFHRRANACGDQVWLRFIHSNANLFIYLYLFSRYCSIECDGSPWKLADAATDWNIRLTNAISYSKKKCKQMPCYVFSHGHFSYYMHLKVRVERWNGHRIQFSSSVSEIQLNGRQQTYPMAFTAKSINHDRFSISCYWFSTKSILNASAKNSRAADAHIKWDRNGSTLCSMFVCIVKLPTMLIYSSNPLYLPHRPNAKTNEIHWFPAFDWLTPVSFGTQTNTHKVSAAAPNSFIFCACAELYISSSVAIVMMCGWSNGMRFVAIPSKEIMSFFFRCCLRNVPRLPPMNYVIDVRRLRK